MATSMARVHNEEYLNWLRGSMSLLFVKEGIEAFIDKRVTDFHVFLQGTMPMQPGQTHASLCNTCTYQNVQRHNHTWRVKCSSKLCNTWLKQILLFHADGKNPNIACTNLKPQLWPNHPWEVAKCFIPHGNENITAAKDVDVAAILKLLRSCVFMHPFIKDRSLVQEVLDIRHRLMHSNDMTNSDDHLKCDTDKMIQLLNSLVDLTPEETNIVQRAIDNICKLRDKTIDVTLNREVVVLASKMQSVETELASLGVKCNDLDKVSHDQTATSEDLQSLHEEYRRTKAEVDQLKKTKDSFEEFLQRNDLVYDVARLSNCLEEYGEKLDFQDEKIVQQDELLRRHDERLGQQDDRIDQQDEILCRQEEILGQQDERLDRQDERIHQQDEKMDQQDERFGQQDERIDQQDERLDRQDEISGQQDERINQQDERIRQQDETLGQQARKMEQHCQRMDKHDQRLSKVEEIIEHKDETAAPKSTCSWEEHYKDAQQYLLDMYNTICSWENPMTGDQHCVFNMYVPPAAKLMREKDEYGRLEEVKKEESQLACLSYKQIFCSRSGPCTNIYITGDAGTGKTTFCNQLALAWCMAVKNIQDGTVSAEDLAVLSTFKFLFYINLRDTETIYHVEDMIKELLMQYAQISIDIPTLMKTEKCLIVLDGLDEWSCPDGVKKCYALNKHIPGRNIINKTCVFLTTTRSWKYDVSDLKTKDVDKYVELCGIGVNSSKILAHKLVDYLGWNSQRETDIDAFYTEMQQKKLTELTTVPVLLIQLLTMWHYGKDLGNSQLKLYRSMFDLLFELFEKKLSEKQTESTNKTEKERTTIKTQKTLPNCFRTNDYCQSHTELLLCLGELAYKSLFSKHREEALVFKSEKFDIFGISSSDISLCLQCGILSQNKDFTNPTGRYKKFSFLHKKMQEFLAALHIVTVQPVANTLKYIREFCRSIDIMIEMSQVWLFVCGMSPDIARQVLTHFKDVITADTDKQIQNYRQSLNSEGLIRNIQNCMADCVIEGDNNDHKYDNIGLEDLYVDIQTFSYVDRLLLGNVVSCIKSMYIKSRDMTVDQIARITGLLLQSQAVQKLFLYDPESRIPSETLPTFLQNRCNQLTSLDLYHVTLTDIAVDSICHGSRKCLMALRLRYVRLTHMDILKLLKGLSQSNTISHLDLFLVCTKHDELYNRSCFPRIDMSTMTQLQTLRLYYIHVENLPTVPQCVERIDLSSVTLTMTTLCEFAQAISQTRRHVEVELYSVTVREDTDSHVDLKTFFRGCPGLTVTHDQCDDSINTWWIEFHTNRK